MNELIPVKSEEIDGKSQQTVCARELHRFLGVGRKFNAWIEGRIEEYEFKDGEHFIKLRSQIGPKLIRSEVEYFLSLDMAKELCMLERNEKGRAARKYFIEVEKKWRERPSWQIARTEGKQVRKVTTDIIKIFIEYATKQGSKSAEMYYMNFSKMVNTALFEFEGKLPQNLRDQANISQLHALSVAEQIISKSIVECMAKSLPYKEVYQIAKEKIAVYSSTLGKTKLGITERQCLGLPA